MKRKILLPTDFSENAWSTFHYAIELFSEEHCTFYFLNSYAPSIISATGSMSNRLINVLQKNSLKDLNVLKAKAEQENQNSKHEFEVVSSSEDLAIAINSFVEKHGTYIVVMGTKGASGMDRYFAGSNTVRVIQNLKLCPLLVVPETIEFNRPKHIAFPTDFNRIYLEKEINPILDFADFFNAHIHILHVNTEKELSQAQVHNKKTLRNILQTFNHSFQWAPKSNSKSDEIADFIKDFNIDILAMVNYRHSFLENLTKEPVIKKIGFKPTVPFLVIPE